jgi:hypothetical protein
MFMISARNSTFKFGIRDVLMDDVVQFFDEVFIGFCMHDASDVCQGRAGEMLDDVLPVFEQVADLYFQIVHGEGLSDVSVRSGFKAFYFIVQSCF